MVHMQTTLNCIMTAALIAGARTQQVPLQGRGFGTYYYDVHPPLSHGADFRSQNTGGVMWSWNSVLPLSDVNSDYLVAMSNGYLKTQAGRAKYCGKRVMVTANGVTSRMPFFIGDGCERCAQGSDSVWNSTAAAGLDFSYTALGALSPLAWQHGHIDISFEIVNETLYHFDV